MRIFHHVAFHTDSRVEKELEELGVKLKKGPIITAFDIDESAEQWPRVSEIIQRHGHGVNLVSTGFTGSELKKASLLRMSAAWLCGYPMPDDDFGYRESTYDLSDYCSKCGVGFAQKAPFRMRGEPGWGKNHVLQLNWVFDQYFAKPETWQHVFKPFGIDNMPVLDHKTGQELRTVVQLKIDSIASSALKTTNLPQEYCERCHRIKYNVHSKGKFPPFLQAEDDSKAIFKTREYWGSGASAFREIIINQSLYEAIAVANLKGVSFTPIAED